MDMADPNDLERLVGEMILSARRAGEAIMDIYGGDFEVTAKADDSPVTAADHAAEAVILADLARAAPAVPVVSEEAATAQGLPELGSRFFLVDPLDGTREFVRRNGEFTVNIALIEDRRPVAGIVFAPAVPRLFAASQATGAFELSLDSDPSERRPISVRLRPHDGLTVLASRSHADEATESYLTTVPVKERRSAGSSLKFCLVAAGEADLYPRAGRTMEWDTAAGQVILEIAGGSVVTFDGAPLVYGKTAVGLANPGFIARGWK
jgi:3'(2'), 5'-bisphosphate nucleotidase